MIDTTVYTPIRKKLPEGGESGKKREKAEVPNYPTEPFTDGEWYTIHLQNGNSWREEFIELIDSIIDRFTAGEWSGEHEAQIDRLLADVAEADQIQLIKALAIDAFLANATEEEIANFNTLSRYKHNNTELTEEALKKRGLSNGSHNSFGIFTADFIKRERA